MLEANYGVTIPSGKFNLQTSTSKLMVRASLEKNSTFLQDFNTACYGSSITATRYSESKGTKELFQKMNVQDLAEISAMNEGYINAKTPTDNPAQWEVTFSIELSNAGAVKLNQKDFITVQVAGLQGFQSFEIFSLGAAVEFDEHLKISPVSCAAGAQIKFNCLSHYGVVVPKTTNKLTITYINGITQEIEGKELSLIAPDVNEIVYNIDGAVIPYNNWRFFPLPTADRAVISLSTVGFAYLLSSKNYE